MYDDLTSIEAGLAAVTATLDPAVLHGADALVGLEQACRITKLATTVAMLLGRRVHETDAWKASGKQSAAHLLAALSGISLGDAMSLLGTAKKMADLPKTDEAARKGKLSGKQAAEVAKGAAADADAEDELLDLADRGSTSELSAASKRRRLAAAGDDERRHARMRANRALHRFSDDDGSAVMRWRHLPELGAELDAILSDYIDDEFAEARRENRREQRCAYAADALMAALRDAAAFRRGESLDDDLEDAIDLDLDDLDSAFGEDAAPVPAEEPAPTADASAGVASTGVAFVGPATCAPADEGRPDGHPTVAGDGAASDGAGSDDDRADSSTLDERPRPDSPPHASSDRSPDRASSGDGARRSRRTRRRAGERTSRRRRTRRRGADAKVIVRIDHDALLRGHTEPGEVCEIAGIGPVPVASVAALMGDAFLAAVITKGHDVHTVAHLGRAPNAYQQTGLQAQGIRCAVLGCPNVHRLERDHEEDWARTLHTRLDELDWLCGHHHDLKTHHGYRLEPGSGARQLLSPDEQRRRGLDRPGPPDTDRSVHRDPAPMRPAAGPRTTSRPAAPRPRPARPEALTLDL